jgi:hypothetical protein
MLWKFFYPACMIWHGAAVVVRMGGLQVESGKRVFVITAKATQTYSTHLACIERLLQILLAMSGSGVRGLPSFL